MVQFVTSKDEFKTLVESSKDKLLVVDFTATWCGPCQQIAPTFEELSKTYSNVTFIKVDVDEAQDIAAQCGISAMPTFIFFKNGKRCETLTGANVEKLKKLVKDNAF